MTPMTSMVPEPSSPSRSRSKPWLLAIVVAVSSAVAAEWIARPKQFRLSDILESKAYDLRFLMRPYVPPWIAPQPKAAPVTLVWIDAATSDYLQNKPRMLWPGEFGEVITAAVTGGAKVI